MKLGTRVGRAFGASPEARRRGLAAEWSARAHGPAPAEGRLSSRVAPGADLLDPDALLAGVADAYGVPGAPVQIMEAAALRDFAEQSLAGREFTGCVRMEAATSQGRVLGVALVAGTRAVVAIEREAGSGDAEDPSLELRGEVVVAKLPTSVLPVLWLRWAGPLHVAEGERALVADVGAIDRRVRDADEPVPVEAPDLERMWAAPWRAWSLRVDETWLRYVSVPGHGVYVERAVKGAAGVEFAPRPGGLVWGDLVRAYTGLAAGIESSW